MPPNGGDDSDGQQHRLVPSSSSATAASASANNDDEAPRIDVCTGEDENTTAAAGNQNPSQPRPSIRFALSRRTRLVPWLHDMDEGILQALHYDEQESKALQQDVVRAINVMRQHQELRGAQNRNDDQQDNDGLGEDSNANAAGDEGGGGREDEHWFRGLEHKRNETTMQVRQRTRDQVIDDVLTNQERQRVDEDDGVAPPNAERLAAVSRTSSTSARNQAIVMGALDEASVRRHRDITEERTFLREQPHQQENANATNDDKNRHDEDGGGEVVATVETEFETILGAAGRMSVS